MKNKNLFFYIIIIVLLILFSFFFKKISNLKTEIENKEKLTLALTDTITTYKNLYNQTVSEKRTIQTNLKEVKNTNIKLTKNQSKLFNKINEVSKEKKIISAAYIELKYKYDSLLLGGGNYDTINNTIEYVGDTNNLYYYFLVDNVRRVDTLKESNLNIKSLEIHNEQFIEFHWENNKKEGYPISFSITNTNDNIIVTNLDSYAIPNIKKEIVDPNFWQKTKRWIKKNGNKIIWFAGGFAGGVVLE